MALIAGEISTTTYVDIPKVVRETIKEIGYTRAKYGYDYETMAILTLRLMNNHLTLHKAWIKH